MLKLGFELFKAHYYESGERLAPISLSEEDLSSYLLKNNYPEIATQAQNLLSSNCSKELFSHPMSYTRSQMERKTEGLKRERFRAIGTRKIHDSSWSLAYPGVAIHLDLKGWFFRSAENPLQTNVLAALQSSNPIITLPPLYSNPRGGSAVGTEFDSLLAIPMANRIRTVAIREHIEVEVPEMGLVPLRHIHSNHDPRKNYHILSKDVKALSEAETIKGIQTMTPEKQQELARSISNIVLKSGFVAADFTHIRLCPMGDHDYKIAFVDTKPCGLMVKRRYHWPFDMNGGATAAACGRIGLYSLLCQTKSIPGLNSFSTEVERAYAANEAPKLSKRKIGLSILSLGIFPLINVISACVKLILIKIWIDKLNSLDEAYETEGNEWRLRSLITPDQEGNIPPVDPEMEGQYEAFEKQYEEKKGQILSKICQYAENVFHHIPS